MPTEPVEVINAELKCSHVQLWQANFKTESLVENRIQRFSMHFCLSLVLTVWQQTHLDVRIRRSGEVFRRQLFSFDDVNRQHVMRAMVTERERQTAARFDSGGGTGLGELHACVSVQTSATTARLLRVLPIQLRLDLSQSRLLLVLDPVYGELDVRCVERRRQLTIERLMTLRHDRKRQLFDHRLKRVAPNAFFFLDDVRYVAQVFDKIGGALTDDGIDAADDGINAAVDWNLLMKSETLSAHAM